MKIKDIFIREIGRDIKEVIKVDDRDSVLEEIEEYVATEHIKEELIKALDTYRETINNPSHEINIWVSGFFGSGKSSFAKVFGYLLDDPSIQGTSVATRFFELNEIPMAKALLTAIHNLAPTVVILLDLNTSPNVLREGEPIVLPIYRTLLRELDYSTDLTLAELEFDLENQGTLGKFTAKYKEIYGIRWEDRRHVITAKNQASRILHELDGETYPSAESWSNAASPPAITAKSFARRAFEMLKRRRPGKTRLVLVVDEVGQYVSRSIDRMRHLQGLAEECQKTKGRMWLVATSQEKLTDVVDSLEGKQTELAKAQDRFPIRVDLLPSDIDEVTGKRVLAKTAEGDKKVRELLDAHRNKLTTSVTLQSPRHIPFSEGDFVRLYPLVPYQIQVLIDAVSARRNQGGAPQTMGGSNRTLIRHTQQLLSHPSVGLAAEPIGNLATLDRSYELLDEVIPTAWRHEVAQVSQTHGASSTHAKIIRVIALCADVPGVPMTSRNLAVCLHPAISAESLDPMLGAVLDRLVQEDRIRQSDNGYHLQSPEQKDWEKIRRGIDMKPAQASRLRKQIIKEALGSLTVYKGRTFTLALTAEGEHITSGNLDLDIRAETDLGGIRRTSRSEDAKNRIFWVFATSNNTWEALTEVHRSNEMIIRYDNASQTDAQRELLAEERRRRDRHFKTAEVLLTEDVIGGSTVFRGATNQAPPGDLRGSVSRLVTGHLEKIYPQLGAFSGSFKKAEVLQILTADSLDGLPDVAGPEGLRLFRVAASGPELVTDEGPIKLITDHIEARHRYGEDQNGRQIEQHFNSPPYGATVESIQAALAASMRAGLLEVVSQANKITSATDRRLEKVFGHLPRFRAASFRPAKESGPSLDVRANVSEWLSAVIGESASLDISNLANQGRAAFEPLRQPCTKAKATLEGAGLAVPAVLTTMKKSLERLKSTDDRLVVETMHERQADLEEGRREIPQFAKLIDDHLETLRSALRSRQLSKDLDTKAARIWARELDELLGRARYVDDLAPIKTLVDKIEEAATQSVVSSKKKLIRIVSESTETLRNRYPTIDQETFIHAVRPLRELQDTKDVKVLRANLDRVEGVVNRVTEILDISSTSRTVRHLRVADMWNAPIRTVDDLDSALTRLREAVLSQLGDDSEVRLR